jgi:hypothetical protein
MTDPIGFNPTHYQDLYYPGGAPAVASPPKDINLRQPDSISDQMSINNKPKFDDALLGKTTRDCKT